MNKKKRLLWQLYPTYLLIILISITVATWFSSKALKTSILDQNISSLRTFARLTESQILEHFSPLDRQRIDQLCKKSGVEGKIRITVLSASGNVIGDSEENPEKMDNHRDRPEVAEAFSGKTSVSTRHSLTQEQNLMYVALPLMLNDSVIGVLRISTPLTLMDEAVGNVQTEIFIAGGLICIFAAIISLLISRRITRPIEEIKQSAECFSRGEFHCRLPSFESEEIGKLSETMNQMATELGERIETITRQRNELAVVFSSMLEGVLAIDKEERIINMNEAAAEFFNCAFMEIKGRSIQEVIRNVDLQQFIKKAFTGRQVIEQDIVLHNQNKRILNAHANALFDAEGNSMGALIVLNDVSRLRRLETIRRDFVANVSHEIKTPITAIKGFVQTLREGAMNDTENCHRFLEIIEKHVDRLTTIIEDLLTLSRVEEGTEKNEIDLRHAPIKDVLTTAMQICGIKAEEKGIHVELSCDDELAADINPALLEQAVVNLMDNAIKYSAENSNVALKAKKEGHHIVLKIQDHGCGIDKKHLDRLFERFYRVDKARSRKLGGTGLGLAIVKHIAQAHSGYVTVHSEPLKGSTFALHLPA